MDCKEVEQQIVSGQELTHEAQSHLLHCRDCQDFSMLCLLAEKREGAPSAESDAKCLGLLHRHERLTPVASRRGRLFASIAAALLVVCGVLTMLELQKEETAEPQVAAVMRHEDRFDDDWLLLADSDLEKLELSKEDDKAPFKELYAEIASMEMDFYDLF
ncbi:MAG: hypothetical protein IKS20_14565 [Victivallales bacterium]|nr:hypothetical protein [Victivallales bacterium]